MYKYSYQYKYRYRRLQKWLTQIYYTQTSNMGNSQREPWNGGKLVAVNIRYLFQKFLPAQVPLTRHLGTCMIVCICICICFCICFYIFLCICFCINGEIFITEQEADLQVYIHINIEGCWVYSLPSISPAGWSPSGPRLTSRAALPLMRPKDSLWKRCQHASPSSWPVCRAKAVAS